MITAFTGTLTLCRLDLRRDRVLIPACAASLTALSVGSARATLALYPDAAAANTDLAPVLRAPATLALYGPATLDNLAGLSIVKTLLLGAVFIALMAFAIVNRHTRSEEEAGRLELLGATAMGRGAALAAAVIVATGAIALTSALSVVGLIALGFPPAGSLAFGCAWSIAGVVLTGITAVAAQLTSSARGATGWAMAVFGALYLLRAVGDSSSDGWARAGAWVSPLGWVSRVYPYGQNRWWLIVPALGVFIALVATAFALLARRDLGSGMLPSRTGRVEGPATLGSPLGLAWRLSRPVVTGWLVGAVILGLIFGSLVAQVSQMVGNPAVDAMLSGMAGVPLGDLLGSLTSVYAAMVVRFMSVAAAAAGTAVLLLVTTEERAGRGEVLFATPTSRPRWFGAVAGLAWAISAGVVIVVGVIMGARGHSALDAAPTLTSMAWSAAEAIPAAWACLGAGALLVGLSPRWAPGAWAVVAGAGIVGEFGSTMTLPAWLVDLSPFAHARLYPLDQWDWAPTIIMTVLGATLTIAGMICHRRRDLT